MGIRQAIAATLSGAPFASELCSILGLGQTFPGIAQCFDLADYSPDYWLDLTDTAYLFQDAASTTPSSVAGDPVGAAVARTGSLTVSQSTTARKPTLQVPAYSGLPAPQWDGADDDLLKTPFSAMDGLPGSVLAVFRLDTLPSDAGQIGTIVRTGFTTSPFECWNISVATDDKLKWNVTESGGTTRTVSSDAALVAGVWYAALGVVTAAGAMRLHVGGAQQAGSATAASMAGPQSFFRLGSQTPALNRLIGDIAMCAYWGSEVSADDANTITEVLTP